MRSSSRMCAGASRTGWWCAHRTRCQIMPGRGRGRSMGSWELAALTHGFLSTAGPDGRPEEGATEGGRGLRGRQGPPAVPHHQGRGAPRHAWRTGTTKLFVLRPDFAGPLRSHLHRFVRLRFFLRRFLAAPWLVSTCPPGGLCSAWPARLGGQGGAGGALLPPGSPGKRGVAARRPALRAACSRRSARAAVEPAYARLRGCAGRANPRELPMARPGRGVVRRRGDRRGGDGGDRDEGLRQLRV